jgi:hypothetical protein
MASVGIHRYCACGTRLAADHCGNRCTACARQDHQRRAAPPEVPPHFWNTPLLNDAFASQHVGRVGRAYRKHPFHTARYGRDGISQELLGSWLGITQAQVSRIENGPPIRNLDTLAHWVRTLKIPRHKLWFRLPDQQVIPDTAPLSLQIPPAPTNSDTAAAMRAFRAADLKVGGGHLYTAVTRYLTSEVAPRLLSPTEPADRSIFASAAALTEMAGWMAHDTGREDLADCHLSRATDLARLSNDQQLSAHIMASRSHLARHLHQPTKAIELATTGRHLLRQDHRNPTLAARLMTMEAGGCAAAQQSSEALTLLAQAERMLGQAPTEPMSPWVSAFDEATLAGETARCMRAMGDLSEASHQAQRVVALRGTDRTRSWSFGQLILIDTLIASNQPTDACHLAAKVLDATHALGSYQVLHQLANLKTALHRHRSQPDVATFLDRLRAALNERLWLYRWIARSGTAREERP